MEDKETNSASSSMSFGRCDDRQNPKGLSNEMLKGQLIYCCLYKDGFTHRYSTNQSVGLLISHSNSGFTKDSCVEPGYMLLFLFCFFLI